MTADSQSNDASDLSITQQIRKNVVADKSLSTAAHNVQIVSVGGTVTLSGAVKSADEKAKVSAIAAQVAGPAHVVDQVTVAAPK
jgi:osmotically-inducible protein OsmY